MHTDPRPHRLVVDGGGLHGAARGEVAREEGGVHVEAQNPPGEGQLDDAPVVACFLFGCVMCDGTGGCGHREREAQADGSIYHPSNHPIPQQPHHTHAPAIRFRRVSHPSIHFPQSVNFSGMKMGSSWLSRFSAVANQSAVPGGGGGGKSRVSSALGNGSIVRVDDSIQ